MIIITITIIIIIIIIIVIIVITIIIILPINIIIIIKIKSTIRWYVNPPSNQYWWNVLPMLGYVSPTAPVRLPKDDRSAAAAAAAPVALSVPIVDGRFVALVARKPLLAFWSLPTQLNYNICILLKLKSNSTQS